MVKINLHRGFDFNIAKGSYFGWVKFLFSWKGFAPNYFDCIIFADILEHLKDPLVLLKNATSFLSDGGVIIASIPNIRHHTTIINLLFKGYWPYRERGIHDKTHLRFFTLKNIKEMIEDC